LCEERVIGVDEVVGRAARKEQAARRIAGQQVGERITRTRRGELTVVGEGAVLVGVGRLKQLYVEDIATKDEVMALMGS